jgi:hypothetical protein
LYLIVNSHCGLSFELEPEIPDSMLHQDWTESPTRAPRRAHAGTADVRARMLIADPPAPVRAVRRLR